MQVTLKLFATLSDYLPPHAVRNAIEVTAADGRACAICSKRIACRCRSAT